ncbi:MAG: hypothetical protein HY549_00755 [Elusimicrobia bacterium]|nr:hypothetical protein [Elusimicrobiota bacterium]
MTAAAFLLLSAGFFPSSLNAETLTIEVSSVVAGVTQVQGFHLGAAQSNPPPSVFLVSALKPRFWRFDDDGLSGFAPSYSFIRQFSPKMTWIIAGGYTHNKGIGFDQLNCQTLDMSDWIRYATTTVQLGLALSPPISYYDVFNEPDWVLQCPQNLRVSALETLYIQTYNAVKSAAPSAKLVGPSWSYYDFAAIRRFLDLQIANNLHYDAISWHELGSSPQEVVAHVAEVRAYIQANAGFFCQTACPEIHVNEYKSPHQNLMPSFAVGWLASLEQAKVDAASRACWDDYDSYSGPRYSNCSLGLNGLLRQDNVNPRSLYWVHRAYADLQGLTRVRVVSDSTDPNSTAVNAIASRNDALQEVKILLGRYSCGANGAFCGAGRNTVDQAQDS